MNTVDVVYTWVDGMEPTIKAKRDAFMADKAISGSESTRFASLNEIEFSLLLLFKHVDFLRKVFIITDQQSPNLTKVFEQVPEAKDKIQIIDHRTIFKGHEDLLPTFNSLSIESMMWRITDLQENFIYMNDDFFIIKDIKYPQLFKNNIPVLRGGFKKSPRFKRFIKRSLLYIGLKGDLDKLTASFNISLLKGAKLSGYRHQYFSISHYPNPLRKSTLQHLFQEHREGFIKNASYRFRNYEQFNVVSAANHYELKHHNAPIKRSKDIYMQPAGRSETYIDRKFNLAIESQARYICIQSMDKLSEKEITKIESHLRTFI